MANHSWAILGAGCVTSVGTNGPAVFDALCRGKSGLAGLRGFDPELYETRHAYEIDDRAGKGDVPLRSTRWLVAAISEAVRQSGLDLAKQRCAAVVGTGLRELRSLELWADGQARDFTPQQLHYAQAVRQAVGITTPVYTLVNACAASLFALGLAADMLDGNEIDVAIVAGCDSITESMFGLLDRASPGQVDCVRPFDKDRKGVIMGEGAAAVVIARPGLGKAPVGVLRGVGMSCDASHETAPDSHGILAAMRDAYQRSGVGPGEIDVVYAHGTGTVLNDQTEGTALREAFQDSPRKPLVTAVKSMTGHTSGGSGLVSLTMALQGLKTGKVPPTIGVANPIDELGALPLSKELTVRKHSLVQVNAFGFGGVNAVAIVGAPNA